MFNDVLIALATFIVTVIAVYWKPDDEPDPNERRWIVQQLNKKGRPTLLAIAAITGCISILKAWHDDREKDFLQLAVASTLAPNNSVYPDLYPHLYSAVRWWPWKLDFEDYRCYHVEALTCFFKSGMNPRHGKKQEFERFGTLVLDKAEVGKMYANWIRKSGNGDLANELANKQFKRDIAGEEVLDKVGLLGRNLFYHFQSGVNTAYVIDAIEGVTFSYGQNASIVISPEEIVEAAKAAAKLEGGKPTKAHDNTVAGLVLFHEIEKVYRKKFKEKGIACERQSWC